MLISMRRKILVAALAATALVVSAWCTQSLAGAKDGLPGWHVLQPGFADGPSFMTDGVIFEWDYLMVHDAAGGFTGSFGVVVADPYENLVGLMPSGGNAAASGKFGSGDKMADYYPFGPENYTASPDTRDFHAEKDGYYAHVTPVAATATEPEKMIWEGDIEKIAWNLEVKQDWAERADAYAAAFPAVTGYDVSGVDLFGLLDPIEGQHWTVDMHWMRTRVTGEVVNKETGEVVEIDGWGYRENSYGAWAFAFSGWDFGAASDEASGIQWSSQSYHHSNTMDYLDVSFYDGGELKAIRFYSSKDQFGWYHRDWQYDSTAEQCMPQDTVTVAMNSEYIVEGTYVIGENQASQLSDMTILTDAYVIQTLWPIYSVTIRRATAPFEVVASFADVQGGGEFSSYRYCPEDICGPRSHGECLDWGSDYSRPFPSTYCRNYRTTAANHVYAGRAYTKWWNIYTKGSNQYIGKTWDLWPVTIHSKVTQPGSYFKGSCQQ